MIGNAVTMLRDATRNVTMLRDATRNVTMLRDATRNVADIPSPSSGVLEIGPLSVHAYGLMIALGVVAAVWLTGRRMEAKGVGTREDIGAIAVWAVLAGIIGARLYHVATDWEDFSDDPGRIVQIWKGGLGIPGGMLAGVLVGMWRAKRRGLDMAAVADCAAPALPLAQAIGRWGNYFNQELFGKPTDLPWGLEIDRENRPLDFADDETFHPTFLYESLWNLALAATLLLVDRRWRLRRGNLLALYVVGYGVGRFWVEALRIDPADEIAGLRFNQWVALALVAAGLGYLLFVSGRPAAEPAAPVAVPPGDGDEGDDLAEIDAASGDDPALGEPDVDDAPVPERGDDDASVSEDRDRGHYVAPDG